MPTYPVFNQFQDGAPGPPITNDGGVKVGGPQQGFNDNSDGGPGLPILPKGKTGVKVKVGGPNTKLDDIPELPRGYPPIIPTGPVVPTVDGPRIDDPRIYTDDTNTKNWVDVNSRTNPKIDPPIVSAPPNPCIELRDYGHVLWDYGFQWQSEILSFAASPAVTRIAAFDDMSFQTLVGVRNGQFSYNGKKFSIVCTGYYIKDYLCSVAGVSYSTLSSMAVSFAKYNIPALGGEFYITTNGKLCRLVEVDDRVNTGGPNLGDDMRYPPATQTPSSPPKPPIGSGQVYGTIYSDDIIGDIREVETKELWSRGVTTLQNHWRDITSSLDTVDFYIDVWNGNLNDSCSSMQYRILYGDYDGKGAVDLGGLDNETMTKAIYSQYAKVLLPHKQEKFIISGSEQDYVYIIDVKRARYGTSMDPGNWELNLGYISGSVTTSSSPSSSITFTNWVASSGSYIDETVRVQEVYLTNKVYEVYQGTLEDGRQASGNTIGNFYPNHGVIVLSGEKLDTLYNFRTNRNVQKNGLNPYRLFTSISGASAENTYTDASGDAIGFRGRKLLINYSKYVFVRVKNQLFNFSNNPTFVTGSEGVIIDSFQGQEKAWITTVGLYNPSKELLAVAKLPKPYLKSCTEEALFTIKVTQ